MCCFKAEQPKILVIILVITASFFALNRSWIPEMEFNLT